MQSPINRLALAFAFELEEFGLAGCLVNAARQTDSEHH